MELNSTCPSHEAGAHLSALSEVTSQSLSQPHSCSWPVPSAGRNDLTAPSTAVAFPLDGEFLRHKGPQETVLSHQPPAANEETGCSLMQANVHLLVIFLQLYVSTFYILHTDWLNLQRKKQGLVDI